MSGCGATATGLVRPVTEPAADVGMPEGDGPAATRDHPGARGLMRSPDMPWDLAEYQPLRALAGNLAARAGHLPPAAKGGGARRRGLPPSSRMAAVPEQQQENCPPPEQQQPLAAAAALHAKHGRAPLTSNPQRGPAGGILTPWPRSQAGAGGKLAVATFGAAPSSRQPLQALSSNVWLQPGGPGAAAPKGAITTPTKPPQPVHSLQPARVQHAPAQPQRTTSAHEAPPPAARPKQQHQQHAATHGYASASTTSSSMLEELPLSRTPPGAHGIAATFGDADAAFGASAPASPCGGGRNPCSADYEGRIFRAERQPLASSAAPYTAARSAAAPVPPADRAAALQELQSQHVITRMMLQQQWQHQAAEAERAAAAARASRRAAAANAPPAAADDGGTGSRLLPASHSSSSSSMVAARRPPTRLASSAASCQDTTNHARLREPPAAVNGGASNATAADAAEHDCSSFADVLRAFQQRLDAFSGAAVSAGPDVAATRAAAGATAAGVAVHTSAPGAAAAMPVQRRRVSQLQTHSILDGRLDQQAAASSAGSMPGATNPQPPLQTRASHRASAAAALAAAAAASARRPRGSDSRVYSWHRAAPAAEQAPVPAASRAAAQHAGAGATSDADRQRLPAPPSAKAHMQQQQRAATLAAAAAAPTEASSQLGPLRQQLHALSAAQTPLPPLQRALRPSRPAPQAPVHAHSSTASHSTAATHAAGLAALLPRPQQQPCVAHGASGMPGVAAAGSSSSTRASAVRGQMRMQHHQQYMHAGPAAGATPFPRPAAAAPAPYQPSNRMGGGADARIIAATRQLQPAVRLLQAQLDCVMRQQQQQHKGKGRVARAATAAGTVPAPAAPPARSQGSVARQLCFSPTAAAASEAASSTTQGSLASLEATLLSNALAAAQAAAALAHATGGSDDGGHGGSGSGSGSDVSTRSTGGASASLQEQLGWLYDNGGNDDEDDDSGTGRAADECVLSDTACSQLLHRPPSPSPYVGLGTWDVDYVSAAIFRHQGVLCWQVRRMIRECMAICAKRSAARKRLEFEAAAAAADSEDSAAGASGGRPARRETQA